MEKTAINLRRRSLVFVANTLSLGIVVGAFIALAFPPKVTLDSWWVVIGEAVLLPLSLVFAVLLCILVNTPRRMSRSMVAVLSLALMIRATATILVRPQALFRDAVTENLGIVITMFGLCSILILFRKPIWTVIVVAMLDLGGVLLLYAIEAKPKNWFIHQEVMVDKGNVFVYLMLATLEIVPLILCWSWLILTYSKKRRAEILSSCRC